MKQTLILLAGFLFYSFSSVAQDNKPVRTITKGYYAIGNNARKLSPPLLTTQIKPAGSTNVQKGYYSIGNNNEKLAIPSQMELSSGTPVIKKGYYSIGGNPGKLRR